MKVIHFPAYNETEIKFLPSEAYIPWDNENKILGTKIRYWGRDCIVSAVNKDPFTVDLSYEEPGPGLFRFVKVEFV